MADERYLQKLVLEGRRVIRADRFSGFGSGVLDLKGTGTRISFSVVEEWGYVRIKYSAILTPDGSGIRINGMPSAGWDEAQGDLALGEGELLAVIAKGMVASLGNWHETKPGDLSIK